MLTFVIVVVLRKPYIKMFMRFAMFVGLATHSAWADKCPDLCSQVENCASDKHGSYCKETNECFGLFFTDETKTKICFEPTNIDCTV